MDFEKIKRNLRLRSGRSKKSKKQTASLSNGTEKKEPAQNALEKNQQAVQNEIQDRQIGQNNTGEREPSQIAAEKKRPEQPLTREYSFKRNGSDPALRVWDQTTALPRIRSDCDIHGQAVTPEQPRRERAPPPVDSSHNQATGSTSIYASITSDNQAPTLQRSKTEEESMQRPTEAAKQASQLKERWPPAERSTTETGPQTKPADDMDDFDLRPPVRTKKTTSLDDLSDSLFGGGHLETILRDPEFFGRFTAFLNRYRPQAAPVLIRYLEMQKAMKAIEYANAVAEGVVSLPSDADPEKRSTAAQLDTSFQAMQKKAFEDLLSQALPAYVTYNIIRVSTEIMVNEITGRSTPIMKGLVSGLTEVFCLTDPNQEDNPIIYASEEFYNMTGYSRDFVIGSNCRFLQGPKSKRHSVHRLRQAIDSGQEHSEALLNYRRDGRPFMNLLMIAPLHDNKGNVKYHIGAQIDASGLVRGGKGLDAFERYLTNEQAKKTGNSRGRPSKSRQHESQESISNKDAKKKALNKLGELSDMFDLEESAVVAQRSRSDSRGGRSEDEESTSSVKARRRFAESSDSETDEDGESAKEKAAWSLAQTGSSGKLPGVYQSYLLMRPSPSMKIIFTSPGLKKMGNLVQSPFMSHVTAPLKTLKGMKESFVSGNPVTAKVLFSAEPSQPSDGKAIERGQSHDLDEAPARSGKACWISATPLLGADDQVGVWMVVFVDQRSLSSAMSPTHSNSKSRRTPSRRENNDQADSRPKTPTPTSRAARPNHIAMPERLNSQQNSPQVNVANKTSTRKSSMMPERTESGRIMVRKDEPLYRQQQCEQQIQEEQEQKEHVSTSLSTPRPRQESVDEADEFVRKYEPRDVPPRSDRIHIQPDPEDEEPEAEEDAFTLPAGTDNGEPTLPKATEDDESLPADAKEDEFTLPTGTTNGQGMQPDSTLEPKKEADLLAEKDTDAPASTEPLQQSEDQPMGLGQPQENIEAVADRAIEEEHTSTHPQDQAISTAVEPTTVAGKELFAAVEPTTTPPGEQAVTVPPEEHGSALSDMSAVKLGESAASPVPEPLMSPSLQMPKDPEADAEPVGHAFSPHTESAAHSESVTHTDSAARTESATPTKLATPTKPVTPTEPTPDAQTTEADEDAEEGEYEPVHPITDEEDEGDHETKDITGRHGSTHPVTVTSEPNTPNHEEIPVEGSDKEQSNGHLQRQATVRHTPMDYLRHPGSRPTSAHQQSVAVGGAGMTGMATGTSIADLKGLRQSDGIGLGHDDDVDCVRTPFSID